jgi:hypothetical protein
MKRDGISEMEALSRARAIVIHGDELAKRFSA